jgi:NAD(P)H dehydrogenase (quinone)
MVDNRINLDIMSAQVDIIVLTGGVVMILVLGGNSVLGRMIISKLQTQFSKDKIIISVRDLKKAKDLIDCGYEVRQADFDDKATLKSTFSGITTLFFISGTAPTNQRIQQHKNVVETAKESGIKHVFYTSFIDVSENSPFAFSAIHAKTESFIKQSGLFYTILRNNLYADFLARLAPDAYDCISLPTTGGRIAFISREDIATFAVKVLLKSELHQNKIYELTGAKAYSFFEIAELITEKNKKNISYVPATSVDYMNKLIQTGLPKWASQAITSMYEAVNDPTLGYAKISSDFEKVVGHSPRAITTFLPNLG